MKPSALRRDRRRLSKSRFLGGPDYSIADIATFPWLRNWENQGVVLAEYPHLKAWFDQIAGRPAVQRGVKVLRNTASRSGTRRNAKILFGKTQYERR